MHDRNKKILENKSRKNTHHPDVFPEYRTSKTDKTETLHLV